MLWFWHNETVILILILLVQAVELLSHAPQCSILFSKFIPAYHHHYGHQCRVSDYGFTKLIDLFDAIPDIVKVSFPCYYLLLLLLSHYYDLLQPHCPDYRAFWRNVITVSSTMIQTRFILYMAVYCEEPLRKICGHHDFCREKSKLKFLMENAHQYVVDNSKSKL